MTVSALPKDYQDILQILPHLPAKLSPPARDLGRWLAHWQGAEGATEGRLDHPRLSLFAAHHGVAHLQPEAIRPELESVTDAAGDLSQIVTELDADLRFYEMNLAQATADLTQVSAMSQQDCLRAMVYGMMAVEPGLDVLALASCGDGQQLAAAVMLAVLLGQPLPDVLLHMGLPASLEPVLSPALPHIQNLPPCEVLEQCGSPAFAALVGAMLAARMARIPVLIADWGALAACAVVHRLASGAAAHIMLAGAVAKTGWWPRNQTLASTLSDAPGMNAALALQSLREALLLDADSI